MPDAPSAPAWSILVLVVSLAFPSHTAAAPVLRIAAAADLATCLPALNAAFAQNSGPVEIQASTGASGSLFAQIANGAPFDVFLSADMDRPRKLAQAGFAGETEPTLYALGRLVLVGAEGSHDIHGGLAMLKDPKVNRIAIANPATAPYGRAAKVALERAGLWGVLQAKLVFGENLAQVAQFVDTGNAQFGLLGRASLRGDADSKASRFWQLPDALAPPIEQGAILTRTGVAKTLAHDYMNFLGSKGARSTLRTCGYDLPDAAPAAGH